LMLVYDVLKRWSKDKKQGSGQLTEEIEEVEEVW